MDKKICCCCFLNMIFASNYALKKDMSISCSLFLPSDLLHPSQNFTGFFMMLLIPWTSSPEVAVDQRRTSNFYSTDFFNHRQEGGPRDCLRLLYLTFGSIWKIKVSLGILLKRRRGEHSGKEKSAEEGFFFSFFFFFSVLCAAHSSHVPWWGSRWARRPEWALSVVLCISVM